MGSLNILYMFTLKEKLLTDNVKVFEKILCFFLSLNIEVVIISYCKSI